MALASQSSQMRTQHKWCVALLLLASSMVACAHTHTAFGRERHGADSHYMTLEERRMAALDKELDDMALKQEQAAAQKPSRVANPLQQIAAQRQALLEIAAQAHHAEATRLHSSTSSAARSFAALRGSGTGHTRCPTGNGFMSCPYDNAECCADGNHCCRPGTRCSTQNGRTQCASTAQDIAIHPTIIIRRHQPSQSAPSASEMSQENQSEQRQEEVNGMDRDDPLGRDAGPPPADDAGPIKQNIIIVKNINVLTHGIQQAPYVTGAGAGAGSDSDQSSASASSSSSSGSGSVGSSLSDNIDASSSSSSESSSPSSSSA